MSRTWAVLVATALVGCGGDWFTSDRSGLPSVNLTATVRNASEEGPQTGRFAVTRTGSTASAMNVSYSIGGTASPADYLETLSCTVGIEAGQDTVDIVVTPVEDGLAEGVETLALTLTTSAWYNVDQGKASGYVTITDQALPDELVGFANSAWPGRGRDRRCTGRSPYVGPQTNRVEWTFSLSGFGYPAPVMDAKGVIYTPCWNDKLYAINPDGTQKWTYTGKGCLSPCVAADGTIYWGAPGGRLVALDPADGHEIWSITVGGTPGLHLTPNIGRDGTIYLNLNDGAVAAINPDGTLKWRFETGSPVNTSVAIGPDDTIYAGNDAGDFYAINPNCTEKWHLVASGAVGCGMAIGDDGTIYVPAGGYLAALSPDGNEKWAYHIGGGRAPALAPDGTIVVKTGSGYSEGGGYVAINPDGTRRWHYPISQNILTKPAIGADGTVYFGTWDSNIRALDITDGSLKWSLNTGGWIECHPLIGADGTLYIGSNSGRLYAIKDL